MDKRTICLLNDSFPPEIDGVANAVVNYAKNITNSGKNAIVVTPAMPGADDSAFPFPVLRYPSIDTRKKLGYVVGYPFSPETARVLTEQKVELMHEVRCRHRQGCARQALAGERHSRAGAEHRKLR